MPPASVTSRRKGVEEARVETSDESCSVSPLRCHAAHYTGDVADRPYYGPIESDPYPTAADIQVIFDDSLNVPSFRAPDVARIKPNEPENSFMMYRIDATTDDNADGNVTTTFCSTLKCDVAMGCGRAEPFAQPQLPAATRDIIRRWIAQGATND